MGASFVRGTPASLEEVCSKREARLWFDEVTREMSVDQTRRITNELVPAEELAASPKLTAAHLAWQKLKSYE